MIEFDIGAFLIGVGIGILIALKLAHMVAKGLLRKLAQELEEETPTATINGKTIVDAVITKEKDTFYIYQKDNDRFLAQGKTLEELHNALQSRFKDMVIRVDKMPDELKQKVS